MSWVRVDDKAWSHPKMLDLPASAVRLWLFGLCWSNDQGTDGVVSRSCLRVLGGNSKTADMLVSARLWEVIEGGWQIHDFLKYQPSKAETEAKRAAIANRVKRHRGAVTVENVTALHPRYSRDCNAPPVPSRPVPSQSAKAEGASASREELTRPGTDPKTHSHRETAPLPRREPLALVGTPDSQATPETQGRANSGAANTSPVSPERARSVNPGACVPCSPQSCTVADVTAALSGSQVPAWAIPDMLQKVHTHFGSDQSDVRTRKSWVKKAATWIVGDWIEGRRPTRPGEPAGTRQVVKVPLKTLDHKRFPGLEAYFK